MPATLHELFAGHTETLGAKPKAEIAYVVLDAADEAEVRTLAAAQIPVAYLGLDRTTITLEDRLSPTAWKVTAAFETAEPQDQTSPEPVFTFDTSGGTQHITQSKLTVNRYGPAASAALGGAIGYDGDQVTGVDITVPVYAFSETHYLADTVVTAAYKGNLFSLTGTVNNAAFRGFAAGECLFLGASGSKRGADRWELSFKFAAQPNRTGLAVGTITGISKLGWDYLWVQYGDDVDAAAKILIKKPIAVYVERVYDAGSFALLGIGT